MILLTGDDLAAFSDATRAEILRRVSDVIGDLPTQSPLPAPLLSEAYRDIRLDHVEDITFKRISKWMEGLPAPIVAGVRIFAEQGPVIEASALLDAGINVRRFQSATTRRTRAITGDSDAYFLGWDSWRGADDPKGRYAVSPITHQSLRRYFRLA
jgi:hypothetical protein